MSSQSLVLVLSWFFTTPPFGSCLHLLSPRSFYPSPNPPGKARAEDGAVQALGADSGTEDDVGDSDDSDDSDRNLWRGMFGI